MVIVIKIRVRLPLSVAV